MKTEQIEHMWKVASNDPNHDTNWHDPVVMAFAALVASAEREEWERKYARLQSLMAIRETQPNKPCCLAEREACAKLCEEYAIGLERNYSEIIADKIRARGQA